MLDTFDFVIFGSGFGGSIMAMVLRRLGYSVLLLERGTHPRFVIGESSTPFANLLLEQIAAQYDLPVLRQLSEWGQWQTHHRDIACGLKRGFTFYHHEQGKRIDLADRSRQLLVAASPSNRVADTHWYRPQFDEFLVNQAQTLGAVYLDRTTVESCTRHSGWNLVLSRSGQKLKVSARFAIDASGATGFLANFLGIETEGFNHMPDTRALFAHFRHVPRQGPETLALSGPPYPPDDAAVHHLFDGGWMWVLRFNNGITSAGFALKKFPQIPKALPAEEWAHRLGEFPTLHDLFSSAERLTEFHTIPQLSFHRSQAAGADWALLPSAVGFVDPLLSTGFALNLLGIVRLAHLFGKAGRRVGVPAPELLADYQQMTLTELHAAADLISALYMKLDSFPEFTTLSLLYFAALSYTESAWRLGRPHLAKLFLLANDAAFTRLRRDLCHRARIGHPLALEEIVEALRPWNIAGLGDRSRQNWYPAQIEDLVAAREKLGATVAEIRASFPSV